MNTTIKKIYGLQLPHPSYRFSNIPLSLGYLASYLQQSDLVGEVDMQIAPSQINDHMGDSKLLTHLGQIKPDMLAFSVYPWNIDRTVSVARQVKKLSDGSIKIVFGGPEIHSQNPMLTIFTGADYLVTGEGEISFVEVICQTLFSNREKSGVKSAAFWDGRQYHWNQDVASHPDLTQLPSPYLQESIPLEGKIGINLFSYRGCHFKCKYCQWRTTRRIRKFPLDQVLAELDFALSGKNPIIYISDAAINLSPHFPEICRYMSNARPFNKSIRCFVHIESLTEEQARGLSYSGINGVEVGLQSIDKTVNQGIDRHFEKEKFQAGLALLKKYNIRCVIDIIIGLPYADRLSILNTIDYVKNLDLNFRLFHLSVPSGCQLYLEKEQHKLELQTGSPYYVLSTDCLRSDEIHALYADYLENSADHDCCLDIAYPGNVLQLFDDEDEFERLEKPPKIRNSGITDWIIRSPQQEPFYIDYQYWVRQSASKLSIWFIADRINLSWLLFFNNLVTCLNANEKHTVVNIYFQIEEAHLQLGHHLEQLNRQIGHLNTFLINRDHFVASRCKVLRNDKGHICIIAPESALPQGWPIVFDTLNLISLKDRESIKEINFNDSMSRGYCVAIHPAVKAEPLLEMLSILKEKVSDPHRIYFCHPVIQRLWLQETWRICVDPMYRKILLLKKNRIRIINYNDYDLALDAILDLDLVRRKMDANHIDYFAQKVQDRLKIEDKHHVSP